MVPGVRIRGLPAGKRKRKRGILSLGRHCEQIHSGNDFITKCTILLPENEICIRKALEAFGIHECIQRWTTGTSVFPLWVIFCPSFHCVSCDTPCTRKAVYSCIPSVLHLLNGGPIFGRCFGADQAAVSYVRIGVVFSWHSWDPINATGLTKPEQLAIGVYSSQRVELLSGLPSG